MINKIRWEELFKVKIADSREEFQKHEVVKLLIVMKLINKYAKDKNFIRIYTEFNLDNGLKCDVYFENARKKEVLVYEIQKKFTPKWLEDRKNRYKEWDVPFMNSCDWIPISLNKLSNNLNELNRELDEYVF